MDNVHSAEALTHVENFQTLWISFVNVFTECSNAPTPSTTTFEDGMRRLRLAHQFLLESLSTIQHHAFQLRETYRKQNMSATEFALGRNAAATISPTSVESSKSSADGVAPPSVRTTLDPSPCVVLDLITKKVACVEENMELATEIMHTIKLTTSTADWTRFALILSRGAR
jgi:hypothetical protein|tara:strand:+ start:361 stop:873 length:513 start_codon:yes stop_codon:yes gene_type:complete